MGREVRMVPSNWEHPQKADGSHKPLHGFSYAKRAAEWDANKAAWESGEFPEYASAENRELPFEEWEGERPVASDYMPDWPEAERTHLQMYENTTEGTPISPVMATPEELARWLADNGASAFGYATATYEQWLATIKRGWAVSAVLRPGAGLVSGVADSEKAEG